jgi:hypothetical protein
MLSEIMVDAIMLRVVMLNVGAPFEWALTFVLCKSTIFSLS